MIRPNFEGMRPVDDDVIEQQILANRSVPLAGYKPLHDIPLAVVGGGASTRENLQEIVAWPGHIWGINQSAQWLSQHGRTKDVWLFSVAPTTRLLPFLKGVERALLASQCNPQVFQTLNDLGADVRRFNLFDGHGPTSVSNTLMPSAMLGYKVLTYFGCEGSFVGESHCYRSDAKPEQLIVRAGGKDYVTSVDMYITTQYMATAIREYPERMKEKSGGLLRAMIEDEQWGVVALSEALRDRICPELTDKYESPAH